MASWYETGYCTYIHCCQRSHCSCYCTVGVDFFQQHKLTVDFSKATIQIFSRPTTVLTDDLQCIWQAAVKHKPPVAATQDALDVTTDSAIPDYGALKQFDLPYFQTAEFSGVISESNQKQPSCKKGAAPIKAMVKKDVKSKVAAKKWL